MRMRNLIVCFLLLAGTLASAQQTTGNGTKEFETQTLSVSGNCLTFHDALGGVSGSFEVIVNGGPATLTTTVNGVMRGGTLTVLGTNSSTVNSVISTAGGPFDLYTVCATWTGGVTPSITVNRTSTIARKGTAITTTQGNLVAGGPTGPLRLGVPWFTTLFSDTNVCKRIKDAIAASLAGAPGISVDIDATAENGIMICPATDAATMFDALRANNNIGGTITLPCGGGIYADGPGVSGHFSDSFSSVAGTPAFIIPDFVTVKGGCGHRGNIGGSNILNSVLGICDGSGVPFAGCTSRFPVRYFTVSSEAFVNTAAQAGSSSSTTTCTPNGPVAFSPRYCTLFVTVSDGPFVLGGNGSDAGGNFSVYVNSGAGSGTGENVALVNCVSCTAAQGNGTQLNQTTPADNAGNYEVSVLCTGAGTGWPTNRGASGNPHGEEKLCSTTSQIGLRVRAGANVCSAHCGNLLFGTAAVGMAPPGNVSYTASINGAGLSGFGMVLEGVTVDVANALGAVGVQCYFCQEHSAFTDVNVTNISYGGFVDGTTNTQNYGPYRIGELYAGSRTGIAHNWQCGPHTFGVFHKASGAMRGFDSLTINTQDKQCQCTFGGVSACSSTATVAVNAGLAAFYEDGPGITFTNSHCEGYQWCLEMGDNEQVATFKAINLTGQPSGNNTGLGVAHVDPRYQPYGISLEAININAADYGIYDEFNLGASVAYPAGPFSITSVTLSSGNCTYNGTIAGGGNHGYKGLTFNMTGFAVVGNNGIQVVDDSTATSLIVNGCGGGADTTGTASTVTGLAIKDPRIEQYTFDMDSGGANGTRVCTAPNCPSAYNYGLAKINTALPCYAGASPAVCHQSISGYVAIPAGTNPTLQVNTTAVTANSGVSLTVTDEAAIGTLLGVTCNSTIATLFQPFVTARTTGASFTIGQSGTTAAATCVHYVMFN